MSAGEPTNPGRPFTGMTLDRASVQRKDPRWVSELAARADARVIAAGPQGVLGADGGPAALARLTPAPGQLLDPILLGLDDGVPLFAVELGADDDALLDADADADARAMHAAAGASVISLRDAGVSLPPTEAGLAAFAVGLLNWHRRSRFCANCGAATELSEAGFCRHCPNCQANHFPRTDPVVIMTVEHERRLLLGRRAGWPEGQLSVLAGFVSPGESAEEAVTREVQEESGIVARDPVYVASQPWPFPASLMLGFHAESDGGDPIAADGELEEVVWVGIDALRAVISGERSPFRLPGTVSIARYLIELWVTSRAGAT